MREYSFTKDGFTFERVSKATARRVFNNNKSIMLCPCNLRPETGRYTAFYIPVTEVDRFTGETPTAATLGTVKQYDYNYMQ